MSVVAVKITDKEIQIGCDTQVSKGGYMKYDLISEKGVLGKVEQHGDLTIGVVGDARMIQMFPLFLETNKLKNNTEREIVRLFKAFEMWLHEEADKSITLSKSAFIIVAEGKVFEFHNFYIRQINDFWAIGSGSIWALPSLELGTDVKKSVEVACKYDLYCSGEPKVITIKL